MHGAVSRPLIIALTVLAITNVVILGAVLASSSLLDRSACNRTRVTRQSLLALRDVAAVIVLAVHPA